MARCLNHGIHWIRITYGCNDHFFCTETRTEVVWQIWGRSKKCRIVVNLNLDVKYSTIYQKNNEKRAINTLPGSRFLQQDLPKSIFQTIHLQQSRCTHGTWIYLTSDFTPDSAKKTPTGFPSSWVKVGTTYPGIFPEEPIHIDPSNLLPVSDLGIRCELHQSWDPRNSWPFLVSVALHIHISRVSMGQHWQTNQPKV